MNQFTKFIGMDVHKATITVSVAEPGGREVRYLGEIANTTEAIAKLVRQLRKDEAELSFCYEAGPCGYDIHRQLTELGWDCQVVAPSLIPKKAGDRVKTDRRDSMMLARLHRAGELTAVWVPDDAQEALRDLTRAREDMKHLQRQARQRLLAFLLRYVLCRQEQLDPGSFPLAGRNEVHSTRPANRLPGIRRYSQGPEQACRCAR